MEGQKPPNQDKSRTSVQVPSVEPALFQNILPKIPGDIHICGHCEQRFSDISLFVEHKLTPCVGNNAALLREPTLSTATGVTNFSVQLGAEQNGGPQIVCTRLLGMLSNQQIATMQPQTSAGMQTEHRQEDTVVASFHQEKNGVCTNLLGMESAQQPQTFTAMKTIIVTQQKPKQEESASQPANDTNLSSLRAGSIVVLRNIEAPESREHLDLGSITLPSEEAETLISSDNSGDLIKENKVNPCTQLSDLLTAPTARKTRAKKRHDCKFNGCSFFTYYQRTLVRHERKHTGERPFQCNLCQKTFSRDDKLQMHLRIHSGVKPYRCDQCDYASTCSGSLRKHMRIHSDERPYKCQTCPYRARDSSQLTVHSRIHTGDNPFVCPHNSCSSAFKTSSDLKRHVRMHTGEKPYACAVCDYKCAIKSNLRAHFFFSHTEVKTVYCNICGHVSSSKPAAKKHKLVHEAVTDDSSFVCPHDLCSSAFKTTSDLKRHVYMHKEKTPLVCAICNYKCAIKSDLLAHFHFNHKELKPVPNEELIHADSLMMNVKHEKDPLSLPETHVVKCEVKSEEEEEEEECESENLDASLTTVLVKSMPECVSE